MKLTVENLCKKIKDRVILDNINLNLESGNVYGFVGRNGSGKTMLFRAVSGLINIDSGKVMLDEKELHKDMQDGKVVSAYALDRHGIAAAVAKMAL